jgi:hypothetical protein
MTTDRLGQALDDLAGEAGSYARVDAVLAAAGRRRRRRAVTMTAAGVLAIALGGGAAVAIASPGPQPAPVPPAATGVVRGQWTSCAAEVDPLSRQPDELTRLGEDFYPVAVTVCRHEARRRPDGGTDHVLVELRGDDVAALVAALRLPDLPRPTATNVFCALLKVDIPWMALLDADGRWIRPEPPARACGGDPRQEVMDAAKGLKLRRVSTTVVGEIESAEAAAAGCTQQWSDMVAVETAPGSGRAAPGHGLDTLPAQVRLCVYRVPTAEQGNGKPAGDFEHGGPLPAARRAQIGQALAAAPPAAACTTNASRFAVLLPVAGNNGEVYIELDGCRRILAHSADGRTRVVAQGGEALTQLIDHP